MRISLINLRRHCAHPARRLCHGVQVNQQLNQQHSTDELKHE